MNALEVQLRMRFGPALKRNHPLAGFTSLRIGGTADLLVTVDDEEQLSTAMAAAHEHSVPVFCLGAGTNLLVSDRGIHGLVLTLGAGLATVAVRGNNVSAGAAMQFRTLVERVVEHSLAGLEFGEGIPGTVGGGLVMNAGAFGGEIARVVTLVHGVTETGERRALTNQEVGFAYRRSTLPRGFVITQVEFVSSLVTVKRYGRKCMQFGLAEPHGNRVTILTPAQSSKTRREISRGVCSKRPGLKARGLAAPPSHAGMPILSSISGARAPRTCVA